MSENKGSFAERFAKKPARTSTPLQKAPPQKKDITPQKKELPNTQLDPQKKSMADLIYLVKGVDAGRNAWYYVLVERLKLQLFLKALNDDIIHLENYGKILYSAYGDEPPAEITNKLKAEYGIK